MNIMTSTNIAHHQDKNCFILSAEIAGQPDQLEAKLEYEWLGSDAVDFTHTYVPPAFRGKGYAAKLVKTGLAWAQQQGFRIEASCSYVDKIIARNQR